MDSCARLPTLWAHGHIPIIGNGVPVTATLKELSQALMHGVIDPETLADHFISRIEGSPDATVYINTTFDRARHEAAESARRYRAGKPLGPLDGIPVAWKDTFDVRGVPTTAGSALLRNRAPAAEDAEVVAHLAAAGMVTLGKLNMSEFAYSALGLNPHFGTPVNPWSGEQPRVPGGSSSGCGVAVASGLAPVSIGTDTGGSVRVPASFNGLVGYKPSYGRYGTRGLFELSRSLDTIGVFARCVEDCWVIDLALRGASPTWPQGVGSGNAVLHETHLVVPANLLEHLMEAGVEANFRAAIARFADAGVHISVEIVPELDVIQNLSLRHGYIASAEAYCTYEHLLEGPQAREITPFVYRRIMASKTMSAHDLLILQRQRVALRDTLSARLGDRVLAMPTTLHVAPMLHAVPDDLEAFAEMNARTIRNTMWANMLDACGVALPCGFDGAHMPTSILLSARAGQDAALLLRCMRLEACLHD